MKKISIILLLVGLIAVPVSLVSAVPGRYVNTGDNLVKNGDFEKGSSGWRGAENIVQDGPNNICRIVVDREENIEFYQKIKTRDVEHLAVKFRIKKSGDYKGEGLQIKFDRGDGTGSGTSRELPRNHDWNDLEWTAHEVVRGKSQITIVFVVKKGESGSLAFDNIEVFKREETSTQSAEPTVPAGAVSTKDDEYRIFTDKSGRDIEAKIIYVDSTGTKVTVQRTGTHKSTTVPVTVFNDKTQTYIKSWSQKSDFLNERMFYVKFCSKKEKVADKSSSGSSGTDSWSASSIFYGHHMDGIIHNKSRHPFNDVKLEYTLFYSQEISSGSTKRERAGTLYEKSSLDIPPKSQKPIKTEQIILHSHSYSSSLSSSPNLKGKLQGMLVHLTLKTDSGELVTREIAYPEKSKFTWTTRTRDVQRPIPAER